ncbi:hypothetical protein CERSUDRAFT_99692 [Gelatoporia subvermispora B]|uniref:Uncharacterized protein n=1 Tax=Ceriporiopsis subvermispora (strain B) TaxID=914234 RepID=M2R0B5_CERS8|nr:hypothetical protein CERSUDRAFT_99692 [Gelatoporia subvermispora B]
MNISETNGPKLAQGLTARKKKKYFSSKKCGESLPAARSSTARADILSGLRVYAAKQACLRHRLAKTWAAKWLKTLTKIGSPQGWLTEYLFAHVPPRFQIVHSDTNTDGYDLPESSSSLQVPGAASTSSPGSPAIFNSRPSSPVATGPPNGQHSSPNESVEGDDSADEVFSTESYLSDAPEEEIEIGDLSD